MTAMVQEFDGVRELSMEEVDAVSGAGLAALARGAMAAMRLMKAPRSARRLRQASVLRPRLDARLAASRPWEPAL